MTLIFVGNTVGRGQGSLRAAVEGVRTGGIIEFSKTLSLKMIRLPSGSIEFKKNIVDGSASSAGPSSGAIALNTKNDKTVKISHSIFVDYTSGKDAKTIWLNFTTQKNSVLTNIVFAGRGNVNCTMRDGGGNSAASTIAGWSITANARYLADLKLRARRRVGQQLVAVSLSRSPMLQQGKDIGAFDAPQLSRAPPRQAIQLI
ncbi:MAG: hypothetical protein ABG776_02140, partial [Cyanobacteria bacterium J06555_13]